MQAQSSIHSQLPLLFRCSSLLSPPLDLSGSLVTDIMMATDAVVAGEDVVDCLGIDPVAIKTIKKPGLYKRRASRNPNLDPLPKIKMPSPHPTILPGVATIITDGAAECVQAMYSKTAHDYQIAPGTDFYYTRGDLPGMLVNGRYAKDALVNLSCTSRLHKTISFNSS